jgi:chromosome segregation ATPase
MARCYQVRTITIALVVLFLGTTSALMAARGSSQGEPRQLMEFDDFYPRSFKSSSFSGFNSGLNFEYGDRRDFSSRGSRRNTSTKSRRGQEKPRDLPRNAFLDKTIENIQLKKSLDTLREERTRQINDLKEENAKAIRDLREEHAKALKALREKNEELAADLKVSKERNDRVGDLRGQVSKLEEENTRLGRAVSRLTERSSELTAQLKAEKGSQSELADLQKKLKDADKENADLKSELAEAKREASRLREKLADGEKEVSKRIEDNSRLSAEIKKSSETTSIMRERLSVIIGKFEEVMAEVKECKNIKERYDALKEQNETLFTSRKMLLEEIAELKDSLKKTSTETKNDCLKELERISGLNLEVADLKKKLSSADSQVTALTEKGKSSIQELNRLEVRITDLQDKLSKAGNQDKAFNALKEENERLKANTSVKSTECEKRAENLTQDLTTARSQITELRLVEQRLSKQVQDSQTTIEGLRRQIATLSASTTRPDQSKELADLQKRLDEALAKLKSTEEALAKASASSTSTVQLNALNQQIKDLQITYVECRKNLNFHMMQERVRKPVTVGETA